MPLPQNTGKKLRTFNLLKRLQKSHRITYVCHGNGQKEFEGLENVSIITVPHRIRKQAGPAFYADLGRNIFSPRPYIVDSHYSRAMAETVRKTLGGAKYDLVHCEWTPYTEVLKNSLASHASVLSAHNVEAQIWRRYFEHERNPARKIYIYLQWQKLHRYEARSCHRYSRVAVVSPSDRDLMERWYGCRDAAVVPNGVDEAYFAPRECAERPLSLVFTGSMDWRPNQDAMKYFLEEIYPRIEERVPGVSLSIVGRNPPGWLCESTARFPNVKVTGTVEDVRPFIAEGALYIVPLRIGGGSRLKILEALSMEKTVLSTTVGAEGLETRGGKHLLIQDNPQAFAETAAEVLRRPEDFKHLGKKGRELVLKAYTWDAIAGLLGDVWAEAAKEGK